MIHPDTAIKFVSEQIGLGVFATADIPKGTLIYVRDPLEQKLAPRDFNALDTAQKAAVEKYSYVDAQGNLIVSWDHAKYMNHSCECNTIGTAYGFEIALRDIKAGEELTTEYGVLNIQLEYAIGCGCRQCRGMLRACDIDHYHMLWDGWIVDALKEVPRLRQPLWPVMDAGIRGEVEAYLAGSGDYRPILTRKWRPSGKAQVHSFEFTFK
ncbi:MAG TPA: SET domain-containing protein [Gammaproteobacteria bacterium]|nr:SET domain-containing protein [Gammaproteobacteria bacterium]